MFVGEVPDKDNLTLHVGDRKWGCSSHLSTGDTMASKWAEWPQKEEEKQATLATTASIHAFFIAHCHMVIRHCMICMSKTVD
jgi:hypothetical protein